MDAQLEPLVVEATAWAAARGRQLDGPLLASLLDLRLAHDGAGDAWWPAGSARHLMLVRLPQHGPADLPDAEAVVSSLDAWWRWLRATGRMSAASAAPADLVAEARRARRGMEREGARPAALARRTAWAAHRERLAALADAAPAAEAGPCFRDGDLAGQLAALAAACDGVVLDGDVLPLVLARALYDELGLGLLAATHDELQALLAGDEVAPGPAEPLGWDEAWTSAADAPGLDRAWFVALGTGLVVVADGTARRGRALPDDGDDAAWRDLGVECAGWVVQWAGGEVDVDALLMVLLQLDAAQREAVASTSRDDGDGGPGEEVLPDPVGLDEATERWLVEAAAVAGEQQVAVDRAFLAAAAAQVVTAVACFDDLGAWRRDGAVLWPTALGHDVARALAGSRPAGTDVPPAGVDAGL